MRFVLVNGRAPRLASFCSLCGESIREGYLRDLGTGALYCKRACYREKTIRSRPIINGWRGLLTGLSPAADHSERREIPAPVSRPLATKRCS
jgi:hypothetical protein